MSHGPKVRSNPWDSGHKNQQHNMHSHREREREIDKKDCNSIISSFF